jgi:hypothetical protein
MSSTWIGRPRRPALAMAMTMLLVTSSGCGDAAADVTVSSPPEASAIPTPAPSGSAEPNLAAGPDGVYLTWLQRVEEDRHRLAFARWDGASWSEPTSIMERAGLFVNWADFPSMAVLADGTMAAHWLQRTGPGPYAYDVHIALSTDGGRSWSDDVVPHRDGVQTEHGFVSLFPYADGFGAVWLDGREMPDGGPMTLRFTTLSRDGALGEEVLLDPMVCECCQTGAAIARTGPIVVYRGRTGEEVRDILITRHEDGAWTAPRTVHEDQWVIPGCPVNGPAVAADGDRVVVAWFTGAPHPAGADASRGDVRRMGEHGRVLAAVSADAGRTFGAPVRIDDGEAMGRVGVVVLPEGDALVTWLERTSDAAEVRLRRLADDGGVGPSAPLAATAAVRASGFPRVARFQDAVIFAWTQTGEPPQVRTAGTRSGGAR